MKYLVKLNRFEIDKEKLKSKLNAKIEEENGNLIVDGEIKKLAEIKEIYELFTNWKKLNFKELKEDTLKLVQRKNIKDYQIKTKFLDKIKISAKSVYKHINPYLKHENIFPKEDSNKIIYIEFKKEDDIYYRLSYSELEESNAINFKFNFTVILENPSLVSEIGDFLRLCWIFKMPLIIVTKEDIEKLIKRAKEETKGIDYEKFNLKILKELPENFTLIGFSKHSEKNEKDLISILNENNVALVFGDDKFGLTQEARDKMNYMFRLTPETKKPLRASHALSYILGIHLGKKL